MEEVLEENLEEDALEEILEVDRPGKLGTLVRGAQSERPKKERQSGVVKVDGS